ncbi:MAG: siphovirus ReqiPepy6 Gp37-like family protein [Ruminococcus sp.]|nr:siphovirus ReqiPepy6 Gp37-like family protein [Ruminococcus sp.]
MWIEIYQLTPVGTVITVELETICDTFSSLIWNVEYYSCGAFEIYIAANAKNYAAFQIGKLVGRSDDKTHYGIIESVQLQTDAENGDYLTVTGRFLMSLLERRIIYPALSFSSNTRYSQMIYTAIRLNCLQHDVRNLPGLAYDTATGDCWEQQAQLQVSYANLMEWIYQICEQVGGTANVRLRKISDKQYDLAFTLSAGTDRSVLQSKNSPVIFSDTFQNLLGFGYSVDAATRKNVAYAFGAGEGEDRKRILCARGAEPEQLERYEIYVDAKDLQTTQQNDAGETVEIPEDSYLAMLKERGLEQLLPVSESSESTIAVNNPSYQYNVDYFVGDYVTIQQNAFGLEQSRIQLTGMIETFDQNGRSLTPTFQTREV